jgi:Mpv17 / PMP22 family
MIPSVRLRERCSATRSSEGSMWSNASFLFRILLCVGILPMIFPESEALVTNLSLYNSKLCHRSAPFCYTKTAQSPFSRRDVHIVDHSWSPKQETNHHHCLSAGKGSHNARSSGRIKTRLHIRNEARYLTGSWNGSMIQFTSWILSMSSVLYSWARTYRWMYKLSIGLLIAQYLITIPQGILGTPIHQTMITWYMTRLNENPIFTKSISAGLIAAAADYVAQWLEHLLRHPETTPVDPSSRLGVCSIYGRYSRRRGISTLVDGLLISGPLMHFAYEFMESILPIATGAAAIVHVLADSVFIDSILVASRFFTTGLMEGLSLQHLLPQFRSVYIPSLKASWVTSLLMSPLQFSCFRFLPLSVRVLSVNVLDVIWDAVISFMTHRSR